MKHKVAELEGSALDAAVALCEGFTRWADGWKDQAGEYMHRFHPSTSWEEGGQIIERERIQLMPWKPELAHIASWTGKTLEGGQEHGYTALIAAMRAYVASKFGEEVELP